MVLISSGISRCLRQGLILFLLLTSCFREKGQANISILWENDRATGIIIPRDYFQVSDDSVKNMLNVHLIRDNEQPAMLGEIETLDGSLVFKPIIPFTRGLNYDVRIEGKSIARIEIPITSGRHLPTLNAIYPSQDTLPYNLLKIYLEFNQPMREGQSLQYITLLKNGTDTVPAVFLDLQPELWNGERTLLTLWLDPGRIKRDLQPNQQMGEPLEENTSYRIMVSKAWNNTEGATLQRDYYKDFFVHNRDSLPPNQDWWTIISPKPGTQNPVQINFHEPMDFVLLNEAIRIKDREGNIINGKTALLKEETVLSFTPDAKWVSDEFIVESESRLEDLAGNNLNRSFDRDLQQQSRNTSQDVYRKKFNVH